jgi:membrane-bound lytic murein transglycosylase A
MQRNHQKIFGSLCCVLVGSAIVWTPRFANVPLVQAQSTPAPAPKPLAKPPVREIAPIRPVPALQRLKTVPEDVGLDALIFRSQADRAALVKSIDRSLSYLGSDAADRAYRRYPIEGIRLDRVQRSLKRFKALVQTAKTPEALRQQVQSEFFFYRASGKDGQGSVGFTGYFEPVYAASLKPTAEYRFPLYRKPSDFDRWSRPHPTRAQLEGKDGLQANQGKLRNSELVWMSDRLQAFLVQVQGSARLTLTDGRTMAIGFDGNTDYPYTGIGKEMVKDGKFKLDELTLPKITQYLQDNPAELDEYLPRNNRFVFFRNTQGALATGSLGLPVTAHRSIATDKKLMPPGALALIDTELPNDQLQPERVGQFVLDQDTGGAIVGPGRVDVFMGTGDGAKAKAGLVRSTGKLYYLILKK